MTKTGLPYLGTAGAMRQLAYHPTHAEASSGTGYRVRRLIPMPAHLDPWFLKLVVFIYYSRADAEQGKSGGGTGFLVGVPMSNRAGWVHSYIVSNSHVVGGRTSFVRINLLAGGFEVFEFPSDAWVHHPDGDDVATASLDLDDYDRHDFAFASTAWFVTRNEMPVGEGDDAFFIGRQWLLDGKERNTPTVRFGAISMTNPEPIPHPITGRGQESFVVEARSIGGFSGSPVFAYRGSSISAPKFKGLLGDQQERPLYERWPGVVSGFIEHPLCLLGIDWGHMRSHGAEIPGLSKTDQDIALNSGMMLVVPAWKIQELLDVDVLRSLRAEEEQRYLTELETDAVVLDVKDQP